MIEGGLGGFETPNYFQREVQTEKRGVVGGFGGNVL